MSLYDTLFPNAMRFALLDSCANPRAATSHMSSVMSFTQSWDYSADHFVRPDAFALLHLVVLIAGFS